MLVKSVSALLIIVGLINLLPVTGVISAARLSALYGIEIAESNLLILMRHRALLFGLIGGFMIWSAFKPAFQPPVFVFGFVSMLGFVLIAWQVGSYNDSLRRVFAADIIATVLLAIALILFFLARRSA